MTGLDSLKGRLATVNRPLVAAILSGKGGVGKSVTALSLAVKLAGNGIRTLLADLNLGLGSQHVLAGITSLFTVEDVLEGSCRLREAARVVSDCLVMIPARSGFSSSDLQLGADANLLCSELGWVAAEFDVVVCDCAAGISRSVLTAAQLSDVLLIETTPEVTAIADAYALVKYCVNNELTGELGFVVNRIADEKEGQETSRNLQFMLRRFLGVTKVPCASILELAGFSPYELTEGGTWQPAWADGINSVSEVVSECAVRSLSHWSGDSWLTSRNVTELNLNFDNDDNIRRDSGTRKEYVFTGPELESSRKDSL
jgi:flagellar biosynthesis protein FlhG